MNTYLLFKAIHLIAVISWMAGLLYLPRIFVYHSESIVNNKSQDLMSTFKTMERRLFIYKQGHFTNLFGHVMDETKSPLVCGCKTNFASPFIKLSSVPNAGTLL